jgi:hypothetical protein
MEKIRETSPLRFVYDDRIVSEQLGSRRRHAVLFYEEPEYAAQICFGFVLAGLDRRRSCGYVSKDPVEYVRNEMMAAGALDYEQLVREGILKVEQFADLYDYPGGAKKGLEEVAARLGWNTGTRAGTGIGKGEDGAEAKKTRAEYIRLQAKNQDRAIVLDRTVLKSLHKVRLSEEVKANMSLEKKHHTNFHMFAQTSLLVSYPVCNILATAKSQSGVYSDWMDILVRKYDTVIYAFSSTDGGIALNLA